MPISKADKKKKKKKRLTNEEILKLIKKLKPKTQQTVRINIGDKAGKTGGSSGSAPMPYRPDSGSVVFTHAYAPVVPPPSAIQPVPSAPLPAPTPTLPTKTASFTPKSVSFRPPQRIAIENPDVFKPSKLSEKIAKQFGRYPSGRELLQEEEYTYSKPETFKAPAYQKPSDLGAKSRYELFNALPTINDPYYNANITTIGDTDQAGTRTFNMSSDTWTLTPEGQAEAPIQTAPASISMEETLKQQAEDQAKAIEEQIQATQAQATQEIPTPKKASMVQEINTAITRGFDISQFDIAKSNTYQTGKNKGLLRNNLTQPQLATIYEALKASSY